MHALACSLQVVDGPAKLSKDLFDVMDETFERLGLEVNALVALLHPPSSTRPPSIKLRGEVTSTTTDCPSFELKALIYDAGGDLISEGTQHYPSETFEGFDTIDIWADDVITQPARIRVFAKSWG